MGKRIIDYRIKSLNNINEFATLSNEMYASFKRHIDVTFGVDRKVVKPGYTADNPKHIATYLKPSLPMVGSPSTFDTERHFDYKSGDCAFNYYQTLVKPICIKITKEQFTNLPPKEMNAKQLEYFRNLLLDEQKTFNELADVGYEQKEFFKKEIVEYYKSLATPQNAILINQILEYISHCDFIEYTFARGGIFKTRNDFHSNIEYENSVKQLHELMASELLHVKSFDEFLNRSQMMATIKFASDYGRACEYVYTGLAVAKEVSDDKRTDKISDMARIFPMLCFQFDNIKKDGLLVEVGEKIYDLTRRTSAIENPVDDICGFAEYLNDLKNLPEMAASEMWTSISKIYDINNNFNKKDDPIM